jgi:hypothetical protein
MNSNTFIMFSLQLIQMKLYNFVSILIRIYNKIILRDCMYTVRQETARSRMAECNEFMII